MQKQTLTMPDTAPAEHPAIEKLRESLGEIEMDVLTGYTLADAMREGSSVTGQKIGGWVDGNQSCALGAAFLAAKARGYVQ